MRYSLGDAPVIDYTLKTPQGVLTNGTVAAFTTNPDGTIAAAVSVVNNSTGRYTVTFTPVAVAGAWHYTITSTGAATDTTEGAFVVTAANADLPWAPSLSEVAARIPMRTVELGSLTGAPEGTFTPLTMPDDVAVSLLIDGAVAHVAASIGPVHSTLWGLATDAAANRAAAAVELAQPSTEFDSNRHGQLVAAADASMTRLAARNEALTGTSAAASGVLLPIGSFPEAPAHGDWNL